MITEKEKENKENIFENSTKSGLRGHDDNNEFDFNSFFENTVDATDWKNELNDYLALKRAAILYNKKTSRPRYFTVAEETRKYFSYIIADGERSSLRSSDISASGQILLACWIGNDETSKLHKRQLNSGITLSKLVGQE